MLALVVALFTISNGTTILLGKKFEILMVGTEWNDQVHVL